MSVAVTGDSSSIVVRRPAENSSKCRRRTVAAAFSPTPGNSHLNPCYRTAMLGPNQVGSGWAGRDGTHRRDVGEQFIEATSTGPIWADNSKSKHHDVA